MIRAKRHVGGSAPRTHKGTRGASLRFRAILESMVSGRWIAVAAVAWLGWTACADGDPSDEDLLERFVKDVTGKVDEGLITRALGYTDFAVLPVDVKAPRHAGVYRQDRQAELEKAFRRVMRQLFWGSELRVRASNIAIDGTRADVGMRLMTSVGPLRVETSLEKTPAGWRVSKVHVERGL